MDRGNFRSLLSKLGLSRPANFCFADHDDSMTSAPALRHVVGRALGLNQSGNGLSRAGASMFDHLEQRSMLEGTFGTAIFVPLDGQGQGSAAGVINPADPTTDDDFFSFTAQQTDFVSILADTANEVTTSALDTRITVYSAPNTNSLVGTGLNNGVLTAGLARDGWLGFVAQAGTTYFVVVSSEGVAQGSYTLRINAQNVLFDVGDEPDEPPPAPTGIGRELDSPVPNPPLVPIAAISAQIARRQQDVVFKYIAPTREEFDSLITVNAQSTVTNLANRLNTRIDVYDSQGRVVLNANDSDSGRINDAYTAFKGNPDEVFYVRVRSDEVRNANANLATGWFHLVFDSIATSLTLNPVTRTASIPTDSFVGFGPALVNPAPIPNPSFQTASYEFTSRGNGLTIITVQPAGLAPVQDPAVRLYDSTGRLIAFNDNFAGASAQLEVELVGGQRYFIVVDGFDVRGASQFSLNIESNHTFDTNPDTINDDHVSNPNFPNGPLSDADRRIFEQATALRLSDPLLTLDANRNPVRDRGVRATAAGTGRLHRAGDTDLFQFTAPVDMLMEYAGNNDDLGTSLFIGGNFQLADPNSAYPVTSRNLTTWDANDFWYAGAQYFDPNFNVTYGFNDNPDTVGTDGARVYAMFDWDPNPAVNPTNGVTDRILMIGGDFDLIIPTPFGPATFRNLVGWAQNQQTGQWSFVDAIGSANGPVRAFTTFDPVSFDPDGSGPAEALPDPSGQVLVVGGEFSDIGGAVDGGNYLPGTAVNNLAQFDVALPGWTDLGLGALDGGVFALTTYDFVDPGAGREEQPEGTPPLDEVLDPYDPPISVVIGGEFTGGVAAFDGAALVALDFTSPSRPPLNPFTNGPVYSIQVFNDNDPDGPDGPAEAASVLVLGGLFDTAGDLTGVGNLVKFGRPVTGAEADPADPGYDPRLIWETMTADGGGTEGGLIATGAVLAMTVWDPPDINNTPLAPILVIGGDFSGIGGQAAGNIGAYGNLTPNSPAPGALLSLFGPGANGIVRTLATIAGGDDQEPSIASNLRTGNPQDPLYLGGDFNEVQFDPQAPPIQARGVAQFSAFRGLAQDFFNFSRLSNGVANQVDATDPAAVPPQVFSLAIFDDGNPFEWDRHDRRQTRMGISLSPASGAFLNSFVRVYDSQFNLVYGFDRPGSDTISPPFPDPAGMIDGSLAAPQFNTQLEGIKLWGGETYYIEVSAGPNGGGIGRYNLSIVVDALPPDIPIPPATEGNSVLDDINALMQAEPLETFFARAIKINTTLGTGDGANVVGSSQPPLKGNTIRQEKIRPSVGAGFVMGSDLGNISSLTDTDLYSFRAEFSGTAEIRLATTGIPDEFGEQLGNAFRGETKTLTSPLDGAMRIFDNDFVQLSYVDDTGGVTGEFQVFTTGGIQAPYYRRDPRVIINVEAGKTYFIQVESGQRYKNGAPADPELREANLDREIDWRYAIGGYVLVVNAMAQQVQGIENGVSVTDDHSDRGGAADNGEQATPININNAGIGVATGIINNFNANPSDNDMFRFIAPGEGVMRIRFTPTGNNSTLLGALRLSAIAADNTATPLATGQPIGNGVLEIITNAQAGQTFLVEVEGTSGTEGTYRVDISGIPFVDDYANAFKWSAAQDVRLLDFQGAGQITGRIEISGDTDVFRFTAEQFANFTISVVSNEATLTPAITVYEVSEDPRGNPLFLRLGVNDNAAGVANPAVTVPVSPDRIIPVAPPGEDREYPYYYVIVRGRDPQTDRGTYTLNISLPTTDDHADGKTTTEVPPEFDNVEFPFATDITLDTQTGRGVESGLIEVNTDTDLFKFTAATSGEATIIISRPVDSLLRPRLSIVDADANVILDSSGFPAQATAEDSLPYFPASISISITRGQTYYIIVQGFNDPLEPNVNSADIGAFTVSVNTPPIDDYPNVGEFALSDVQSIISINSATGFGQVGGNAAGAPGNAGLNPTGDTDLFNFTTITAGAYNITVNPYDGVNPTGRFAPRVSLFIASPGGGTLIQTVQAPSALTPVTITIPNANANVKYYILVDARVGLPGATRTGEYGITIQGPTSGNGEDPGDVDFSNPTTLTLNSRTGDVCFNDIIDISGDRDLFRFTVSASGQVFVQLTTPSGSLLDASISIYNQANELITSRVAFDADGIAGVTATTSFTGVAGTAYYAIVDGLGESVGSYELCINSQPAVNRLYFPEGFASDVTREFISIINSNSSTANYTVYLRYEMGETETIIANGSVAGGARGGLTIVDGTNFQAPGIRKNTPYSVIIESDLPLGATMAHYDFGRSIGDSFTETLSTQWNFARVERDNGNVLDYVVFYNPSNFDIEVTLTAYQNGNTPVSLTKVFAGNRRGGFSINDIPNFPTGVFSTILTAKAVNPANQAAFEGVAASLSHYDTTRGAAFGLIGEPNGGSTSGAVTNFLKGAFTNSQLAFFNANAVPVTVTLTGAYMRANLPNFSRTFNISPGSQVIYTDADFGLIADSPVGITYTSNLPITVNSANYQYSDADSSTASINAGTRFLFGDAFIDPALAGNKFFEFLYIHNPTAANSTVNIRLNFNDGTSSSFNVAVNARGFAEVRLHERNEILSRNTPSWFGVDASSASPFTMTMTHYDLLLGGGWATTGVPVGFINPISRIP